MRSLFFYLSCFFVSFTYYIGRSHIHNLFSVSYIFVILVAFYISLNINFVNYFSYSYTAARFILFYLGLVVLLDFFVITQSYYEVSYSTPRIERSERVLVLDSFLTVLLNCMSRVFFLLLCKVIFC